MRSIRSEHAQKKEVMMVDQENFEAFKQKKFKEIEEARNGDEMHTQNVRSLALKPQSLNLRNLTAVEQGPPTFDSEYEFRNMIVADNRFKDEEMEYNLRLQSVTKQFETKVRTQADRYEFKIRKITEEVEALRRKPMKAEAVEAYCHLCSDGEVVAGLKKIMKTLEESHEECILRENESSKKIIALQRTINDCRDNVSKVAAQKTLLNSTIQTIQEENRTLKATISALELSQTQMTYAQSATTKQPRHPCISEAPFQDPPQHVRTQNRSRPASITKYSSLNSQFKRSSTPGLLQEDPRARRTGPSDPFDSELQAAKIIDRVKTNSLMDNPRLRGIIEERKLHYG